MSDGPRVYSYWQRQALKTHRCVECLGDIQPSEKYEIFNGCWDGSWDEYKTCLPCVELRLSLGELDSPPDFGGLFGYVLDDGTAEQYAAVIKIYQDKNMFVPPYMLTTLQQLINQS